MFAFVRFIFERPLFLVSLVILLGCFSCKQHTVEFFFSFWQPNLYCFIGEGNFFRLFLCRCLDLGPLVSCFVAFMSLLLLSFCDFNEYHVYLLLSFQLPWELEILISMSPLKFSKIVFHFVGQTGVSPE